MTRVQGLGAAENRGGMNVDRLRELMRRAGMAQNELGRAVGVSAGTMSNYMTRKREPRVTTLRRLCEVLGCRPEDIW